MSHKTAIPQADYADELAYLLRVAGSTLPEPEREYVFSAIRKWKFDFAWPQYHVAVEINGGRWMPGGGRHAEDSDYWKITTAAAAGWRVLPATVTMLQNDPWRFLELLEAALFQTGEWQTTTPRVTYITRPPAGPCSANGGCDCPPDNETATDESAREPQE